MRRAKEENEENETGSRKSWRGHWEQKWEMWKKCSTYMLLSMQIFCIHGVPGDLLQYISKNVQCTTRAYRILWPTMQCAWLSFMTVTYDHPIPSVAAMYTSSWLKLALERGETDLGLWRSTSQSLGQDVGPLLSHIVIMPLEGSSHWPPCPEPKEAC